MGKASPGPSWISKGLLPFPLYPPGHAASEAVGSPLADQLTCRYKELLN